MKTRRRERDEQVREFEKRDLGKDIKRSRSAVVVRPKADYSRTSEASEGRKILATGVSPWTGVRKDSQPRTSPCEKCFPGPRRGNSGFTMTCESGASAPRAAGHLPSACGYGRTAFILHNRDRLNAVVARASSTATLGSPRRRNCRIPRCCFKIPNTGSTIALRFR